MADESDGKEDGEQSKLLENMKKTHRTRSFSLESIENISESDINKIIGVSGKKSVNKPAKTYADKRPTNTKCKDDIRGAFNKKQNETNDDPFKPKNTVINRTPPKGNVTNLDTNDVFIVENENGKRIRSDTTPEAKKDTKRPCDRNVLQTERAEDIILSEYGAMSDEQKSLTTEKLISEVFTALDEIQLAADLPEGHPISTIDQLSLRKSANTIYKCLTWFVHKVGNLEQQNLQLKYKSENGDEKQVERQVSQENTLKFKTYATVSASGIRNMEDSQIKPAKEIWTTPKTNKKLETIVTIENITEQRKPINSLKRKYRLKQQTEVLRVSGI